MRVDIQGGRYVGMPADALDGLKVNIGLGERSDVAVAEDKRGSAVKVYLTADTVEQPAKDHVGNGSITAQDISA